MDLQSTYTPREGKGVARRVGHRVPCLTKVRGSSSAMLDCVRARPKQYCRDGLAHSRLHTKCSGCNMQPYTCSTCAVFALDRRSTSLYSGPGRFPASVILPELVVIVSKTHTAYANVSVLLTLQDVRSGTFLIVERFMRFAWVQYMHLSRVVVAPRDENRTGNSGH